jgi:hypothetical protein
MGKRTFVLQSLDTVEVTAVVMETAVAEEGKKVSSCRGRERKKVELTPFPRVRVP